jgi:hypothetical protein
MGGLNPAIKPGREIYLYTPFPCKGLVATYVNGANISRGRSHVAIHIRNF